VTEQTHSTPDEAFDYDAEDLVPKDYFFKWRGQLRVLREATAGAAARYKIGTTNSLKMEGNPTDPSSLRVAGMVSVAEHELQLLADCVYDWVPNDPKNAEHAKHWPGGFHPRTLSLQHVRAFPHRMTEDLLARLKKMSNLDQEAPGKAGPGLPPGDDGPKEPPDSIGTSSGCAGNSEPGCTT